MYGAFEDKAYIHLVMEVCTGGELFDRISEGGHFSEKIASDYIRTIVSVVNHCHSMNVIHRDLKVTSSAMRAKGRLLRAYASSQVTIPHFLTSSFPLDYSPRTSSSLKRDPRRSSRPPISASAASLWR